MSNELVPTEVKDEVSMVQQQANALKVTTLDQAEKGADLLSLIKSAKKTITEKKETITRPLMSSLAAARDLFKPLELDLSDAEKIVKAKILAFHIEEDNKITAATQKVTSRVEKGTMRADTAAGKLAEIGDTPKVKGTQVRTLTKVRIIDEFAIPREYLVPNMTKITEAVLHENIDVPGVEKYEEKSIASV